MKKKNSIERLPNGSLFLYRGKPYFVSEGVDDRIITCKEGHWRFIRDLNWKTIKVVYTPE